MLLKENTIDKLIDGLMWRVSTNFNHVFIPKVGVELISILLDKVLLGYKHNLISCHFSLNQPAGRS